MREGLLALLLAREDASALPHVQHLANCAPARCRRPEQQAELGPDVVVGDILQPQTYEAAMASCDTLVM